MVTADFVVVTMITNDDLRQTLSVEMVLYDGRGEDCSRCLVVGCSACTACKPLFTFRYIGL